MPPLLNGTAAKADTPISGSLKPTYGEFKTPSAPPNCPQTKGFSPFHAYVGFQPQTCVRSFSFRLSKTTVL